MVKRFRCACVPVLLAACVLAGGEAQHALAGTSLPALTVQLTDLRPGYVSAGSQTRTAARIAPAAGMTVNQLHGHGWLTGYQSLFHRQAAPGVEVGSFVDRFRNRVGAVWWYGVNLRHTPSSYRQISLPAVGDESRALQSGPQSGFVAILFRRGEYVAEVYVSLQATAPQSAALVLARRVDLRIRRTPRTAPAPGRQSAASRFSVRAWISPNPAPIDSYPVLYARSVPGSGCSASVSYPSGRSPSSFIGFTQLVGNSGVVSWAWHEMAEESGGSARVSCTYRGTARSVRTEFRVLR